MYKKIALLTLLLSASSLVLAEVDEVKKNKVKKNKVKWAATEKTCGKIDAQIIKVTAKIKAGEAPAKWLKKSEIKKADCVAKGL